MNEYDIKIQHKVRVPETSYLTCTPMLWQDVWPLANPIIRSLTTGTTACCTKVVLGDGRSLDSSMQEVAEEVAAWSVSLTVTRVLRVLQGQKAQEEASSGRPKWSLAPIFRVETARVSSHYWPPFLRFIARGSASLNTGTVGYSGSS